MHMISNMAGVGVLSHKQILRQSLISHFIMIKVSIYKEDNHFKCIFYKKLPNGEKSSESIILWVYIQKPKLKTACPTQQGIVGETRPKEASFLNCKRFLVLFLFNCRKHH